MARDLNKLMDDLRKSRSVFVSREGNVEDETEAQDNARRETARDGAPRPRTKLKPEIFGASSEAIRIPIAIVDAMHAEAARFEIETGGILVGPRPNDVTGFIPSGASAERTSASYQLDVEHLQPLLAEAEAKGLRFLGIWHVHPEGVDELSSTDLRAARAILGDPDWGVDELLLPLSVRVGGGFDTRFFRVARGANGIERPEVVIRGVGSLRTTEHAPTAQADRPALASPDALRVAADIVLLREFGWNVRRLASRGDQTSLELSNERVRLTVQLPPEYPLSPPTVWVSDGSVMRGVVVVPIRLTPSELPETDRWSSLHSLATVANEAERAVGVRVRAHEREQRRVGPRLRAWANRFLTTRNRETRHG
ncbi:MAG: Mov34/MPN/PAD-1 family protein [Polyangiales bacterium]